VAVSCSVAHALPDADRHDDHRDDRESFTGEARPYLALVSDFGSAMKR
jgi:hypothetical protein